MTMQKRFRRRTAGMLKARIPELKLSRVPEVRHSRGRRLWPLKTIPRTLVVCLAAGCKGFGEMEELSDQMSLARRRMLRIPRRLPDTTARDVVVRLEDTALRPCLHAQVKAARRRKALMPQELPFGVVAIAADAAQCTRGNDSLVRGTSKLDYLFRLKDSQPTLFAEAKRMLGPRSNTMPAAESHEVNKPYEEHRKLYITEELEGFDGWEHLRTVLRVEREKVHLDTGEVLHHGTRYFISSLLFKALSPEQRWKLVRCYWAVENEGHNTLDTAFSEDERPWINIDPQGMVAILLLRRMAYNILALFRCVTLRSDDNRRIPWRFLILPMWTVLIAATAVDLEGLRFSGSTAVSFV